MRFIAVFFCAVLSLLLAVAALNFFVNPYAMYPPRWFMPASANDLERVLRELESLRAQPQLVVLGSSRSVRLRARDLECYTGLPSINAAYAGATPEGYFALASYLVENRTTPQTLIVGVDIEAFQIAAKFGDKVTGVPRLKRYLQDSGLLQEAWNDGTNLVSWTQLNDSFRMVQFALGQDVNQINPLDRAWRTWVNQLTPEKNARAETRIPKAQRLLKTVENRAEVKPAQVIKHYQKRFNGYTALSDEQQAYFEAMLKLAQQKNIRVKLFITTLHPDLIKILNKQGFYPKRHAEVRAWLNRLAEKYPIEVYDFATPNTFGGNTKDFFNLSHIDETNSARLIGAMFAENGNAANCAR